MKSCCWILTLSLTAAMVFAGAGCQPGISTGQVKGTVTLDDKPLANGTIRFETPGKQSASGKIVQGQIVEVTTVKPGDGAPVGAHKVAIWALAESSNLPNPDKKDLSFMVGKSLIPASYNHPDTSGLTADIKPGLNTVEFKLVSKAN